MLITELQELEEVKNLVTKGQAVGVVTYGEIAGALAEVDVDEGDIEELYGTSSARASSWSTTSTPRRRPLPSATTASAASVVPSRRSISSRT